MKLIVLVLTVLAALPAAAGNKENSAVDAEWRAIPPGTGVPAALQAALAPETGRGEDPKPGVIVFEPSSQLEPSNSPHHYITRLTLKKSGANTYNLTSTTNERRFSDNEIKIKNYLTVLDKTGLVELWRGYDDNVSAPEQFEDLWHLNALGLVYALDTDVLPQTLDQTWSRINAFNNCEFAGSYKSDVTQSCWHYQVTKNVTRAEAAQVVFTWQPIFGLYLTNAGKLTINQAFVPSYFDIYYYASGVETKTFPHKIVDWRNDGGEWHSKTVSAALSPAQKEQARALFTRGFELYKSGDFVGAKTLLQGGLAIDPANYLALFTLGQVGQSQWKTGRVILGYFDAQYYFQRTIDLAPNSPEALLAKGYIDAMR